MSGVYGLLSMFTGHPINFIQWIYYLSSVVFLAFYIIAYKNIRTPQINQMALVTSLYLFDTLIGIGFTLYFCFLWFTEQSQETTEAAAKAGDAIASATGTNILPTGESDTSTEEVRDYAAKYDFSISKEKIDDPSLIDLVSRDIINSPLAQEVAKRGLEIATQSASETYELFWTVSITILTTGIRFYFTLVILSFFRELTIASKFDSRYSITTTTSSSKLIRFITNLEIRSYKFLTQLF